VLNDFVFADNTIKVYSFSPPPEALNEYYQSSGSERSMSADYEQEHDTVMDEDTAFGAMEA
jgi:hypothetical protein